MSTDKHNARVISIAFPPEMADAIRAQAAADNSTNTRVIMDMLEGRRPVSAAPPTPDQAATIILSLLADDHRRIIEECSRDHHVPVLTFLLSALKLSYERGEAGQLLSEVSLGTSLWARPDVPIPVLPMTTCAFCSTSFTPTRIGQRYCPKPDDAPDSEACSTKAGKQELQQQLRDRVFHHPVNA